MEGITHLQIFALGLFFFSPWGGEKIKKEGKGKKEKKKAAFPFKVNPFSGFAFLPASRRLARAKREVQSAIARAVGCQDHVVCSVGAVRAVFIQGHVEVGGCLPGDRGTGEAGLAQQPRCE